MVQAVCRYRKSLIHWMDHNIYCTTPVSSKEGARQRCFEAPVDVLFIRIYSVSPLKLSMTSAVVFRPSIQHLNGVPICVDAVVDIADVLVRAVVAVGSAHLRHLHSSLWKVDHSVARAVCKGKL